MANIQIRLFHEADLLGGPNLWSDYQHGVRQVRSTFQVGSEKFRRVLSNV